MVRDLVRLLRPTQWIKNAFVAAPLLFAARYDDPRALAACALAFGLFCAAASLGYVINDLVDREADRQHPIKRLRPLAAGRLTPGVAYAVLGALAALVLAGAWWLPPVGATVGVYLTVTVLYSWYLKHVPVVDIFVLAFGFVLRVYAGALAIQVAVSDWMFVTTLSVALFLATVKRRAELDGTGRETRAVLGAYSPALLDRYALAAALGAVTFYALFVMTARPALVITVPIVLFGLFRYWLVTETDAAGEDPTQLVLRDPSLLLTVAVWAGAVAWLLRR